MTLLLFDGFDSSWTNAEEVDMDIWQRTDVATNGYFNGSMKLSGNETCGHNFIADQAGNTLYIGFSLYTHDYRYNPYDVLSLCEGTTRDSAVQWMLTVEDGYFKIYRGDKTTLLATGTHHLAFETWYHIQIKSFVHNSTGIFELKIGSDVIEFSLTSQDLQQQATDSVQRLQLGYESTIFDYALVDDFYICNDVGSAPYNTYLGNVKSIRVYPNADNSVTWTPSTGGDNYALIDEVLTPSTTDYVSTTIPTTNNDTYDLTDMPTDVSSVLAVRVEAKVDKDGVDSALLKHGVKSGGTSQFGSNTSVSSTYTYHKEEFLTSDGVSTAWTETTINGMQLIIEDTT